MAAAGDISTDYQSFHSVVDLLAEIEKRPAMYTTKPYISCLKSFLDGWYAGKDFHIADANVLADFQQWIEQKYHSTTTHSWADIILYYSAGETEALSKFFRLFKEFLAQTT